MKQTKKEKLLAVLDGLMFLTLDVLKEITQNDIHTDTHTNTDAQLKILSENL